MDSQKRWFTGKELMERRDIKGFELLCYIKEGLPAYDKVDGRKIICSESLEHGPKHPYEFIEATIRAEQIAGTGVGTDHSRRLADSDIKEKAEMAHALQPLEILSCPENCIPINCNLPTNEKEARRQVEKLEGYLFRTDDILKFEEQNSSNNKRENSNEENILQNNKLKKPQYPSEVIDLINNAKSEMEMLYTGMKSNVGDISPDDTYEDKLEDAALECFKKHEFKVIKLEYVKELSLYYRNIKDEVPDYSHHKRDFIGKLCQIIICDHFPKILPEHSNPPQHYGAKSLYENLFSKV